MHDLSQGRFELLRGPGTEAHPPSHREAAAAKVAEAPEVRALPKADLRRTLAAGLVPASRDLLFVRLHPAGAPDLTVTVTPQFQARERQGLPIEPYLRARPVVDVPFVFVHGAGDVRELALPGVHVVDLSEGTPEGCAPHVEFRALEQAGRTLPVVPVEAAAPGAGTGVVVPGALFAFDSAFPTPAILWHLDLIDDALEAAPDQRLAVFGHADATGSDAYNKRLSDRRAQAVLALLTHDLALFDRVAQEDGWDVRHDQAMLRALGHDPGAIDGQAGALTRQAARSFQRDYNAGLFHEDRDGPRAHPDLVVDGVIGEKTRAALRDAYVALSPTHVPAERLAAPGAAGCSEFNLAGTGDAADDRRVVVAFVDPAAAASPPCRLGDARACRLDGPAPKRCGFYRAVVLEEVRPEAPRFWEFLWLRERDGRAHLSALTSLADGTPVSFTVHRCTKGPPSPPPESSSGAPRPDLGPVLGRARGRVVGGVAFARWRPPRGFDPFDPARWVDPEQDDADPVGEDEVPDDDDPIDRLLERPGAAPPAFVVEGGGHWAVSDPPGRRLSRLRFPSDGEGTALLADGRLVRFQVEGGRVDVERDVIVVAVLQDDALLSFAAAEEGA